LLLGKMGPNIPDKKSNGHGSRTGGGKKLRSLKTNPTGRFNWKKKKDQHEVARPQW